MNMKNRSAIAGVVLAGLATGAAAWYLLGTSNGKQVCNKVLGSVKDLSSSVIDKASGAINDLSGRADNATKTVIA